MCVCVDISLKMKDSENRTKNPNQNQHDSHGLERFNELKFEIDNSIHFYKM